MALFDGYSADELNRVLTLSKWVLGCLAVLTATTGIFNQWISDRIATLQKSDKAKAQLRLQLTETELEQTKVKTAEVASKLGRLTVPRSLTELQISTLRQSLPNGPSGKVVITFLSVERDAENYSEQISKILSESGFEVIQSSALWLQFAFDGVYLCVPDVTNVPAHAVHIQNCFKAAGIRVKAHQDPDFLKRLAAPDNSVVLVVSSRE